MKKKFVVCHNIEGKKRRISADKMVFRPSVYGILIERGRILLSKQWDGYDFPGGGSEMYETVEQTLRREFWEETGYRVKVGKIIHVDTSFFSLKYVKTHANCTLMYFLVKRIGGKISTANFDEHEKKYASAAEWIPLSKISKIKFYNMFGRASVKIIRKALRT